MVLFVDHASGYIFVSPQVHLNTHETIGAMAAFESHARDFGVIPQEYFSDNGKAFTSVEYRKNLETFAQIHRLAGVGAQLRA